MSVQGVNLKANVGAVEKAQAAPIQSEVEFESVNVQENAQEAADVEVKNVILEVCAKLGITIEDAENMDVDSVVSSLVQNDDNANEVLNYLANNGAMTFTEMHEYNKGKPIEEFNFAPLKSN